jgi:hypothetical protein
MTSNGDEWQREAVGIREAISRLEASGPKRRYDRELREQIFEYTERWQRLGVSRPRLAEAAGLSIKTVDNWRRAARKSTTATATAMTAKAPVAVRIREDQHDSRRPGGVVLVTPGGYRLEGLDAVSALEIVRGLG